MQSPSSHDSFPRYPNSDGRESQPHAQPPDLRTLRERVRDDPGSLREAHSAAGRRAWRALARHRGRIERHVRSRRSRVRRVPPADRHHPQVDRHGRRAAGRVGPAARSRRSATSPAGAEAAAAGSGHSQCSSCHAVAASAIAASAATAAAAAAAAASFGRSRQSGVKPGAEEKLDVRVEAGWFVAYVRGHRVAKFTSREAAETACRRMQRPGGLAKPARFTSQGGPVRKTQGKVP